MLPPTLEVLRVDLDGGGVSAETTDSFSGLCLLETASSSTSESDEDDSQSRPAVVEGVRSFFGFLVLTLAEVEDEEDEAAAAAAASFFALFAAVAMAVLGSLVGSSATMVLEGDVSVAVGVATGEEAAAVEGDLSLGFEEALALATGEGTEEVEREDGLGAEDRGIPVGLELEEEDPEEVGLELVREEDALLVGRAAGRRGGGMAKPEGDRRVWLRAA